MARAHQINNQSINPWTKEELEILETRKGITKEELMQLLPRRSWSAIIGKRKKLHLPKIIKRVPWNVGLTKFTNKVIADAAEKESKRKIALYAKGIIKTWNKGLNGGHWSKKTHEDMLINELDKLTKEGYKCISFSQVHPDGIALKDGKIFAVELERGSPNYSKYNLVTGYDDIFWFVYRP